jgi:hypothetical protein
MTLDQDLERQISRFITTDAPLRAPDWILPAVINNVATTKQRRPLGARLAGSAEVPGWRRIAMVVLVGSLLAAGAISLGALLAQGPDPIASPHGLIVVQPTDTDAKGLWSEVAVTSISADGTTTQLAMFTADALGGAIDRTAAVSQDGYLMLTVSSADRPVQPVILDLRDPTAPPQFPDVEARDGTWGPGGQIAFYGSAGMAVFDPGTGVTTLIDHDGIDQGIERPTWAADGSALRLATDTENTWIDLTGAVSNVSLTKYYDGVGPQRLSSDGHLLACGSTLEAFCPDDPVVRIQSLSGDVATTLWTAERDGLDLADFSWATDERHVWILQNTTVDGPRELRLGSIDSDGVRRAVASIPTSSDDPDPNSTTSAGSIAGIAPDGSRIVVRTTGVGGGPASLVILSTDQPGTTNARPWTIVTDGAVAGWLTEAGLKSPRPESVRAVELDARVQGAWGDAGTVLNFARTTVRVRAGSLDPMVGTVTTIAPDRIRITATALGMCQVGSTADYDWSQAGGSLSLSVIGMDPCGAREAVLTGTFEPALQQPASEGGLGLARGSTYLATGLAIPIRLRVPGVGRTLLQDSDEFAINLSTGDHSVETMIMAPTFGSAAPCRGSSDGIVSLEPGITGIVDFLTRRSDLAYDLVETTHSELAGRTSTVIKLRTTCDRGTWMFMAGRDRGGVRFDTRDLTLHMIENHAGAALVVIVPSLGLAAADQAWVDELLGSIEIVEN